MVDLCCFEKKDCCLKQELLLLRAFHMRAGVASTSNATVFTPDRHHKLVSRDVGGGGVDNLELQHGVHQVQSLPRHFGCAFLAVIRGGVITTIFLSNCSW